jgi:hypothetical protein
LCWNCMEFGRCRKTSWKWHFTMKELRNTGTRNDRVCSPSTWSLVLRSTKAKNPSFGLFRLWSVSRAARYIVETPCWRHSFALVQTIQQRRNVFCEFTCINAPIFDVPKSYSQFQVSARSYANEEEVLKFSDIFNALWN